MELLTVKILIIDENKTFFTFSVSITPKQLMTKNVFFTNCAKIPWTRIPLHRFTGDWGKTVNFVIHYQRSFYLLFLPSDPIGTKQSHLPVQVINAVSLMFTWLEKSHANMDKTIQIYWNSSLNDVFFIDNKTLKFSFLHFPFKLYFHPWRDFQFSFDFCIFIY